MKRERRRTKEQITAVTVDNKLWQRQGKEGSGGETKVTGENERRQEQASLRGKGVGRTERRMPVLNPKLLKSLQDIGYWGEERSTEKERKGRDRD